MCLEASGACQAVRAYCGKGSGSARGSRGARSSWTGPDAGAGRGVARSLQGSEISRLEADGGLRPSSPGRPCRARLASLERNTGCGPGAARRRHGPHAALRGLHAGLESSSPGRSVCSRVARPDRRAGRGPEAVGPNRDASSSRPARNTRFEAHDRGAAGGAARMRHHRDTAGARRYALDRSMRLPGLSALCAVPSFFACGAACPRAPPAIMRT